MAEFKLPDPGEGLVEADIVTWRVAVGETVAINDILVEIETAKSIVELPSPFAGTVTALLVTEGDTVEVGTPIIVVDDGGGVDQAGVDQAGVDQAGDLPSVHKGNVDHADADQARADQTGADQASVDQASGTDQAAGEAADARTPNLVGYGAITGSSRRRARKQTAAQPTPDPVPESQPAATEAPTEQTRVRAKPPVRKLAKDLGVELKQLAASGDEGILTRDDVLKAAAAAQPPQPVVVAAPVGDLPRRGFSEQRVPVKGVRKATAEAMVASAFTAPHVTEWVEVDVTASLEFLERLRSRREYRDLRVSPTLLTAKAVCLAAARTPYINSSWDAEAREIILHGQLNLGIAAATARGLVVPNIKAADQMTLAQLAHALSDLVETARSGRTQPAQMAGGTLTITNIGVFGIDGGTPILNPGESAILATGAIVRKPWVVGTGATERIEVRSVMTLALSFDHRVVDGEQGSRFLADVASLLGDPSLALAY